MTDGIDIRVTTVAVARVEEDLGEQIGAIVKRWESGDVGIRDLAAFARHAAVPAPATAEEELAVVDRLGIVEMAGMISDQLKDMFFAGKRRPRRRDGG